MAVLRLEELLERETRVFLGQKRAPGQLTLELLAVFRVNQLVHGLVDHIGLLDEKIKNILKGEIAMFAVDNNTLYYNQQKVWFLLLLLDGTPGRFLLSVWQRRVHRCNPGSSETHSMPIHREKREKPMK